MNYNVKIPGMMMLMLTLSAPWFARADDLHPEDHTLNTQPADTSRTKETPVYEGKADHQVAVLEKDYPEVAVSFSNNFPGAFKQLWLKEGNNLFVYFSTNDNKVSALFTRKGQVKYAVSNIGIAEVPESLLGQINKKYPGFRFFNARKIEAGGYTAYELLLENDTAFITMTTTDNDEIVEMNKFIKTSAGEDCRH